MTERDLIQRLTEALQERCKYEGPFSEDGELCRVARDYLEQPPPEPVAWVDVQHREEGPYEFHGIALLPKGPHHLYIAPPDTAALQARIAKLEAALHQITLAGPDREIKYAGMLSQDIARAALEGSE